MDYYLSNSDGQYTGPYSKDRLIAAGLDRSTMVWRQGLATWTVAEQLQELQDIMGDVPPPMEMTLGPTRVVQPVQQAVAGQPAAQVAQEDYDKQLKLEELNRKKAALKQQLEQRKAEKEKKLAQAQQELQLMKEEKKKEVEKERKVLKEKKKEPAKTTSKKKSKEKTKYDYPVCDWRNEAIWVLAFVIIHALMALMGETTFFYIYLDIVGAVLSIAGIVIGIKIRKLNATSYKKDSESRLQAEKLGYFNGILVSATAAVGFLIILVQSAHYVYVA